MAINEKLAYEVFKARREKETSQRRYSFALRKFLGENGEIENHPFVGKRVVSKKDGKESIIKRVYLQWYNGYYWLISCVDKDNLWNTYYISNMNCVDSTVINAIEDFNTQNPIQ